MKVIAALLPCLLIACEGGEGYVPVRVRGPGADGKDTLVSGHRDAVRLEDRDIQRYVERMGATTVRTPRGVHVQLLRDLPGEHGRPEQWATINYRIELLNGDTAYSSAPGEPESFLIEHDDVESGLHEAIQHLSPGDSALFIIPSYRAHGLVGDMEKIPMRSSVVYHIGLVKLTGGRP